MVWKRSSLRAGFLLALVLLIVFTMGLVTLVSYLTLQQGINESITRQMEQMVHSAAHQIAVWMGDRHLDLRNWSEQEELLGSLDDTYLGRALRNSVGRSLEEKRKNYPYYHELALADGDGRIIASSGNSFPMETIAGFSFFKKAIQGEPAVYTAKESPSGKIKTFAIAAPVKRADQPIGVLYATINLNIFGDLFLNRLTIGKTGYAYLIDRDGLGLFHPDSKNILASNIADYQWGHNMLSQTKGYESYQWEGKEKTVYFDRVAELGWIVGLGVYTDEIMAPVRRIGYFNLAIAIILIWIAAALGLFLVRHHILTPITELMKGADRLASGNLMEPVMLTVRNEFYQLAQAFNSMMHRLRQTLSDLQQRFSDLKQTESALKKYEQIVSTSQDLMALINKEYVYEALNESLLKVYRKTREEVVGRTLPEIIGQNAFEEKIRGRIDEAFSGKTVHYQEAFGFGSGSRKLLDVTYYPFFNTEGSVESIVVNARDITETRKLEEQLLQAQRIESIGILAGGVAHEINNPLNGIMNYAQLILDRIGKDVPEREYAEEILHETRRIAGIVRNLLTFARNEKQSHSPALLSDIISSVFSLIQTVMRHDQITLEIHIPDDLPKIKCRSQQIQQVLMNLLTNARDALNERFPEYSPEKILRVSAHEFQRGERKYVRVTVEDSGVGISPEIINRIFDPFFTTKPKETGTGLGLSISYGIVRDHGGELSIESEQGKFSRFHVDLPVNNGWSIISPDSKDGQNDDETG